MLGDSRLVGGHPGEGAVPARLQFARDKAVLRIGRIVLPEGAIGGIAGRLEVANHGLACVVTLRAGLRLRSSRGFNGGRLHYAQQRGLDDIVDTQAAKGDAAGLTIIESTADAGVAWDLALGPGVLDGELAATTPTAQQTGQQRRAVLGRASRGGRNVLAHHCSDRLRPVPVDVTLMGARLQRQPVCPRLAPRSGLGSGFSIARDHAGPPIGVGASIGGVGDELAKGRVAGTAPLHRTGVDPGRQVQLVLQKPE